MFIDTDDTPVWMILHKNNQIEPVLVAWYSRYTSDDFLTARTFGTKKEADAWLKEFWQTYWKLA
jgi:hypothetical protein